MAAIVLSAASVISASVLAAPVMSGRVAAASSSKTDRFDLDVIFVIDNSGSMKRADPQRLALSAANLFIDMCGGSDSRVGYVMYTNEILASQPLTDLENFSNQIKLAIAATQWSDGDTDTALGLEYAYDLLLRDSLGEISDRKPVVILLSDGNTDLPRGPRTTEESLAALEVIKKRFADADVPIHTIGFNFDGRLDIGAMSEIAQITDATFHEVKTADRLPEVLRNIYGHLTGSKSNNITLTATGVPQSVIIPIDNSSIYKGTVTISARNPILNASLTDSDGNVYDASTLSSKVSVNEDPNGKYILFTMYKPAKGDWTLNFTGTKDDVVSIDMLSVYDFDFVMGLPIVDAAPPHETQIFWHLEDNAGQKYTDPSLIGELKVTLHVKNLNDGSKTAHVFPRGATSEQYMFPPGDYEAFLTMYHADFDEEKVSNIRVFNVPEDQTPVCPPVSLSDPDIDTQSVKLITIFRPEGVIYLNDLIRYSRVNEPLDVRIIDGDWKNVVELEYDAANEFAVKALNRGQARAEIIVACQCGESSETMYIEVSVASGSIYIIIAAGVLLFIITGLVLLLLGKKPYLDSPMRGFAIEVRNLPVGLEYPQQAELRLEHVKGKRNLQQVINYNRQFAHEYNNSLRDIGWFLMGTEFSCKRKTDLDITIPVNPRFTVQIDGHNQARPYTGVFSGKRELRINLIQDEYYYYEIILGKNEFGSDSWGGGPDTFGGGGQGFGSQSQGGYTGASPDDFDLV